MIYYSERFGLCRNDALDKKAAMQHQPGNMHKILYEGPVRAHAYPFHIIANVKTDI